MLAPAVLAAMVHSMHSTEHHDHPDPTHELEDLLGSPDPSFEPRTWEAPGGRIWSLEREQLDIGQQRIVLTLLEADGTLVCQAYEDIDATSQR